MHEHWCFGTQNWAGDKQSSCIVLSHSRLTAHGRIERSGAQVGMAGIIGAERACHARPLSALSGQRPCQPQPPCQFFRASRARPQHRSAPCYELTMDTPNHEQERYDRWIDWSWSIKGHLKGSKNAAATAGHA